MQKIRAILAYALAGVAIFLAARGIGWYASRSPSVQLQRQVIAKVEELDGFTYYDFQIIDPGTDKERIADREDPDLKRHWLSGITGVEWFHDLHYVTFAQFDGVPEDGGQATARTEITDQEVLPLLKLGTIRWWALSGTAISDKTVIEIASQSEPERLWLGQTKITDKSLQSLAKSKSLNYLAIESTPTTDIGLQALADSDSIESLSLGSPYYTASGLKNLGELTSLQELYADRLPVAGAMEGIGGLPNLRVLSLRGTGIGDQELAKISQVKSLEVLHVDSTLIGDQGLAAAQSWRSLKEITMSSTLVSDIGLGMLSDCNGLTKLRLADTKCTLPGVLKLLEQTQQKSLVEALEVVFETKKSESGALLSLNLSPIEMRDEDVDLLRPLQDLQWLVMPRSSFTNSAMETIAGLGLPKLQLLNVDNSNIDDEGLQTLCELKSIRNIHIVNTNVSPEGVLAAKAKRSSLQVYRSVVRRGASAAPEPNP
ncbi:MAG: hypothetical protein AAF483_29880 [Planctomycetota bacterium]